MRIFHSLLFIICFSYQIFSQDSLSFFSPSHDFNKTRCYGVAGLQTAGYGSSLALLSTAWYKDYKQTSFHFFDDSKEWLQMDKTGHFITAWYLGRIGSDMYEWSGVKRQKAVLYGALSGWGYLTGLEIMDGFSNGWGFSWSDFSANTLGSGLIIGQKILRKRYNDGTPRLLLCFRQMSLKYSFHQTGFPQYRPSLLGKNLSEQLVKDYNGQTYWLSINISSFAPTLFPSPSGGGTGRGRFPKWLNLAFGYGAQGMIGGNSNPPAVDDEGNQISFDRYRQFYLSLDIDLTRIKTKSHFLKTVFETFSFIKIPAPALEFSRKGVKGYAVYY